jgi:hypothetical protein
VGFELSASGHRSPIAPEAVGAEVCEWAGLPARSLALLSAVNCLTGFSLFEV